MQQENRMKIQSMMLAAALALSAGFGAGFSGNSYAVDPVCRGDCADDRQGCNFGCLSSGPNYQSCVTACYNAYRACVAACQG
jgi:hypothetical protein